MSAKVSQIPTIPSKRERKDVIRAPRHLKVESRRFYEQIASSYILESHHLRLLQLLCEAYDRGQEARKILAKEGLTIDHEKLGKRPHPCVSIERDARLAVARLCRELNLSEEPEGSPRPPGLRYSGK